MFTLITGASRGIGKETALYFAQQKHNLILLCKNNYESLLEYSRELTKYDIICHVFKCDISNYNEVESLWNTLSSMNIKVNILINNAGISYVGLLQDMDVLKWQSVMNTNLNSLFYMTKHAIPPMISAKNGRIINISSIWGDVGASMEVAYSASKGGVNAFTKALAKELAPSNISVNAISFGAIDTDMNSHLSAEERMELESFIPASRYGTTKECAKLIYDIANTASYLTGAIITMDGAFV